MRPRTVSVTLSEGSLDGLDAALASVGYAVTRTPLIRCEPTPGSDLQRHLGDIHDRGTLVVTSPRAARVVAGAISRPGARACRPRAVWALGPASADPLRARFPGVRYPSWDPNTQPSATTLARMVLETRAPTPILFACGDRARPDLPAVLQARGVDWRSVVVYRTLAAIAGSGQFAGVEVAVIGSPSAAEPAARLLGTHTRIVAIGPTTARALLAVGLRVAEVARSPDVGGVLAAVRLAMGNGPSSPDRRAAIARRAAG